MKVPLLDLKAQYESIKAELNEALLRVSESQHFILGPEVENLERSLCASLGCKHGFGVSSGTDALLIALMALDIKPGDEVIVPTFSFFATAGVVSRLNATPVFVDVDRTTFNIDVGQVRSKITPRTKAVVPVHLFGQSADMEPLETIAREHGLAVIEDAAQAIGVQYKDGRRVGSIGTIGCFSFFPSKNLGGYGDGGFVTTNDARLAERLQILRVHGGKPKYYHKIIGGNFRLDAIQAAVLNAKLPYLAEWSARRRKNAALYTELLVRAGLAEKEGHVTFDQRNPLLLPKAVYDSSGHPDYHIYNQYVIRSQHRSELKKHLETEGIGTEIYYPVPFHAQECFAELKADKQGFPNADFCAETVLALPIYPELLPDQIRHVVSSISGFYQNK